MANEGGNKELREAKKSYWGVAARECDSCRVSPALLYCRVDSVFLCGVCDSRVHHSASPLLRHERVWICEVCEQAPAAFTCKADAAALCPSCDTDIHSANPLARRHERVPIAPFFDSPGVAKHAAGAPALKPSDEEKEDDDGDRNDREAEAASWLLPNPKGAAIGGMEAAPPVKAGAGGGGEQLFYFSEVDPYLDLDFGSSMDNARFHHQMDSVVPVQNKAPATAAAFYPPPPYFAPPAGASSYEIDFTRSKVSCSYSPSLSHSVSSSEVGVVPDGNATPDVSTAYGTPVPTIPVSPVGQPMPAATPAVGQDREARVMRYREKRKNRKFEKTIRYASRKAYAETRPRIKGRFAKRTDSEENADSAVTSFFSPQSSAYPTSGFLAADAGYGVVPSF